MSKETQKGPDCEPCDGQGRPLIEEAYEQNYLHFRSLNQIMWQIPVLAMTLTGGLWFGVSHVQGNLILRLTLLFTAFLGNVALSVVLYRFRHVMGCYLKWLEQADPKGFVDAKGGRKSNNPIARWASKEERVRQMFSLMLGWGAVASLGLFVALIWDVNNMKIQEKQSSVAYYDAHAVALADSYESIAFEDAYPHIVNDLSDGPLTILDVGAGTGRDAAWLAAHGHTVFAAEPSSGMRRIARSLHPMDNITWSDAALPELRSDNYQRGMFDVVLMNAVWMHVDPEDREAALRRLYELLKVDGRLYVSMRIGPDENKRGFFPVNSSEFVVLAEQVGFSVVQRQTSDDLLKRNDVHWESFELQKK
jgi:2-polyprenyl-3-methyl-5-hydroxy-6-metoxy-1,4-benzoquinol methylase